MGSASLCLGVRCLSHFPFFCLCSVFLFFKSFRLFLVFLRFQVKSNLWQKMRSNSNSNSKEQRSSFFQESNKKQIKFLKVTASKSGKERVPLTLLTRSSPLVLYWPLPISDQTFEIRSKLECWTCEAENKNKSSLRDLNS